MYKFPDITARIKTIWEGDGTLSNTPIAWGSHASTVILPYVIMRQGDGGTTQWNTEKAYVESYILEFEVYSKTAAKTTEIVRAIERKFDLIDRDELDVISDASVMDWTRSGPTTVDEVIDDKIQAGIWLGVCSYQIMLSMAGH